MGWLFILPVAGISGWVIYSSLQYLRRGQVAPVWRSRLYVMLVLGLVLGLFFAFVKKSQPTANFATEGFPIPTTIHRLENNVWLKNNPPAYIKIPSHIANIAFGIAIALLPLKIAGLFSQIKPRNDGEQ